MEEKEKQARVMFHEVAILHVPTAEFLIKYRPKIYLILMELPKISLLLVR